MTILSDDIFKDFGGDTEKSSTQQRAISYVIAESLVATHIGAPLIPTSLSGTYAIPFDFGRIRLNHSYLSSVLEVGYVALSKQHTFQNDFLRNYSDEYGFLPYAFLHKEIYCYPDDMRLFVSYTAGLATGTFTNPQYMLGLVQISQNILYEISDPASLESGPGDVGVRGFSNNGYAENRYALYNTIFGSSAAMQRARKLLAPLRRVKGTTI